KMLFYMRPKGNNFLHGGLWKVPTAGGEETRVIEEVLGSFEVKQQGIYYLARQNKGRPLLLLYEFAKEKTRLIASLQVGLGLTVSPDEQTILYTQLGDQRSDLMLVENFQ